MSNLENLSDPVKIENEARLLIALWDDPQPGLFTWCEIERDRLQTIFNLLHKNGFEPTEEQPNEK